VIKAKPVFARGGGGGFRRLPNRTIDELRLRKMIAGDTKEVLSPEPSNGIWGALK
jgi:hypothetical protein